jgi:hypothetical protein
MEDIMRKTLLTLVALVILGGGGVAPDLFAQIWETSMPGASLRVSVPRNQYSDGLQWTSASNSFRWLFNGNQAEQGQKYELEIEFTSNRNIAGRVELALVDQTATAGYWTLLTEQDGKLDRGWTHYIEGIRASTPVTAKFTFDIFRSATNATGGVANGANTLCITAKSQTSDVVLTFTKFTLRRIQ